MAKGQKKLPTKKLWRTAAGVEGERIRRSSPEYRAQLRANYHRRRAETADHRAAVKAARAEHLRIERAQKAAARAERQRERSLAWRTANQDRMRELVNGWKRRNLDKVAKYRHRKRKEDRRTDPGACNAERNARRIAKRKATIAYLMTLQHGVCAYCRCDLDGITIHIDHILPRALGGSNERKNLQLTCEPCNLRKSATPPEKFVLQFGRLI